MHEIYLLAVLHNASRDRATQRTRQEQMRDEQAFYDLHGRDLRPRFRNLGRFARALPVALVASATLIGVVHLLH